MSPAGANKTGNSHAEVQRRILIKSVLVTPSTRVVGQRVGTYYVRYQVVSTIGSRVGSTRYVPVPGGTTYRIVAYPYVSAHICEYRTEYSNRYLLTTPSR